MPITIQKEVTIMTSPDEIRREWERRGKPECKHKKLVKETSLMGSTGDYFCADCGEIGPGKDWPATRET